MRDRLTRSNAGEHHIFFALPVRRNDHADRLADRFGGRIAKYAFRRQIPRGDDAGEILADDRIIRRFHDRDEPSAGEGRLHPVRNVPGDFRCANHLTRVVVNRRHRQRNRDERPILRSLMVSKCVIASPARMRPAPCLLRPADRQGSACERTGRQHQRRCRRTCVRPPHSTT